MHSPPGFGIKTRQVGRSTSRIIARLQIGRYASEKSHRDEQKAFAVLLVHTYSHLPAPGFSNRFSSSTSNLPSDIVKSGAFSSDTVRDVARLHELRRTTGLPSIASPASEYTNPPELQKRSLTFCGAGVPDEHHKFHSSQPSPQDSQTNGFVGWDQKGTAS